MVELSYTEVIENDSCAQHISIQCNQVWLEGVDEESSLVSVNVHAVMF